MPSSTRRGSRPEPARAVAETTYAVVAEATSPAASPPTPSATSMQVGPTKPESSLPAADEADVAERRRREAHHLTTSSRAGPTQCREPISRFPRLPVSRRVVAPRRHPTQWAAWSGCCSAISVALVLACGVFGAAEYSLRDRRPGSRRDAPRPTATARPQGVRTALRSLSTQLSGAQVGVTADQPGDRLPRRAGHRRADRDPARRPRAARAAGARRSSVTPRPGAGHHRDDDLRRAGAQEARASPCPFADRPAPPRASCAASPRR